MAVAITMRTRYRIWFSAAVACQGPPRPTQRSATSANGATRSVPARPSNRRPCNIGSDRSRTQSPRRNGDRCKVRYSDGLIDSWDAKGAHADDKETKKRDDAKKDVAHTADGIHWISLLIEAKPRSRLSAGLTRIGSATRKLSRAGTLARTPQAGSRRV